MAVKTESERERERERERESFFYCVLLPITANKDDYKGTVMSSVPT